RVGSRRCATMNVSRDQVVVSVAGRLRSGDVDIGYSHRHGQLTHVGAERKHRVAKRRRPRAAAAHGETGCRRFLARRKRSRVVSLTQAGSGNADQQGDSERKNPKHVHGKSLPLRLTNKQTAVTCDLPKNEGPRLAFASLKITEKAGPI